MKHEVLSFFDVCRILENHKPPMVFLENVKGLKSHDGGKTLQVVIDVLNRGIKLTVCAWMEVTAFRYPTEVMVEKHTVTLVVEPK